MSLSLSISLGLAQGPQPSLSFSISFGLTQGPNHLSLSLSLAGAPEQVAMGGSEGGGGGGMLQRRMRRRRQRQRYAVLVCAEEEPEHVRRTHGGYFGAFAKLLYDHNNGDDDDGEEDEEEEVWVAYRATRGKHPQKEDEGFEGYDGFVVTGSCSDALGDNPWIRDLIRFLQKLIARHKKVLSIYFAHQVPSNEPNTSRSFQGHELESNTSRSRRQQAKLKLALARSSSACLHP